MDMRFCPHCGTRQHKCPVCGEWFVKGREDQKVCRSRCRTRKSRKEHTPPDK